jgi:glycosyltransferase 2 family protein
VSGSGSLRERGFAARHAKALAIVVGLVVSTAFAYIAVRGVHPQRTWDALASARVEWLVPALVLMIVAFFMRAIRWWTLFAPAGRPSLRHVTEATYVGYLANALLPARAGEAAKAVALNRSSNTPVAESVATIFVERAWDVLSLVLLLFLMLPALPHVTWLRGAAAIAAVLLVALGAIAFVVINWGERPLRTLMAPLRWLPFIPPALVEQAPAQFVQGLAGLVKARIAGLSFLWTTLSWIVLGVAYWLVMVAFDLGLSPLAGELVVIGIGLAMILPSSPGAIGVFEGATVVVLGAYGVDASVALSYALVLHVLNLAPLFALGLGALVWRRAGRLRRPPQDQAEEPSRAA